MTAAEENAALLRLAAAGDTEARDRLVENNMGLVYNIAKRFFGRGAEAEDLIQIGSVGLIKAVNKFDLSFDVRFSTYAVPMIMGEIRRFLRDDNPVKISRILKERAMQGARAREKLEHELGREPSLAEISAESGISEEELIEAFDASAPPESLHKCAYAEDSSSELINSISAGACEDDVINRVMIDELLKKLTDRERQVIVLRYYRDMTQTKISKIIGVSQVQVSRIEKAAMEKLRDAAKK